MSETAVSGTKLLEALRTVVSRRSADRALAITEIAERLLYGLGPLRRSDSELRAGDRLLNEDREILPALARASSLGLSLYLGNRRIASASVIDAGHAPPIGGYANATLVDAVLRKREIFRGLVDQDGRRYMVACRAIYASRRPEEDQGPLGMIEAFVDEDGFMENLASALEHSGTATSRLGDLENEQMGALMDFVDDMSRRLQLLALNGNIIAAQAGEHGSAFRVVCRELGSLADRAKGAVGEFRKLVGVFGQVGADSTSLGPDKASSTDGE